MKHDSHFVRTWQLGYRLTGIGGYSQPYVDLPPFDTSETYARHMLQTLQRDFPMAEWRLVECV